MKKVRKPNQIEKFKDQTVTCTFQATIGGKVAPLICLRDEDMDIHAMITIYNRSVTDALDS